MSILLPFLLAFAMPQQDAAAFLKQHLALAPTNAEAQAVRFRSAAIAGAYSEAREAAHAFLGLRPGDPVGKHFLIWLDSRNPASGGLAFQEATSWLAEYGEDAQGAQEVIQLRNDLQVFLQQEELLQKAEAKARIFPALGLLFLGLLAWAGNRFVMRSSGD